VPAGALCPSSEAAEGALVTLSAPLSRTAGNALLLFSHWEVGGVPMPAGQTAIEVKAEDVARAVAIYVPAAQ